MIPKSGRRFSDKIMLEQKVLLRWRRTSGTQTVRRARISMATYDAMTPSAIDRTGRRGSILLVLLLALGLIAAAGGLVLIGNARSEPYILVLLAVLGMIGVFSLFAAAAGILRIAGDDGNHVLK